MSSWYDKGGTYIIEQLITEHTQVGIFNNLNRADYWER